MPNVTLKCTYSGGSSILRELTSDSTLHDLMCAVKGITQIDHNLQKLRSGFPPRTLSTEDTSAALGDLGIRSGDTVHVESLPANTATAADAPSSTTPSSTTSSSSQPFSMSQTRSSVVATGTREPRQQGRSIVRKEVASDNSCLFASIGLLLQGDSSVSIATALRCVVADTVLDSPHLYPEIMLGKPPAEYAKWIQNPAVWGGGIEIAILAKHFHTEIHVVDTKSLRVDKFGQDLSCSDKIYVIYDGIHYDPLYDPVGPVTVFPVHDMEIEEAAMLLAANAKKQHKYTDLANFSLLCGTCKLGFTGEETAREHAKQTGHTNFEEYK